MALICPVWETPIPNKFEFFRTACFGWRLAKPSSPAVITRSASPAEMPSPKAKGRFLSDGESGASSRAVPEALLLALLKPSVTVKVYSTSTSITPSAGVLVATCTTPFFWSFFSNFSYSSSSSSRCTSSAAEFVSLPLSSEAPAAAAALPSLSLPLLATWSALRFWHFLLFSRCPASGLASAAASIAAAAIKRAPTPPPPPPPPALCFRSLRFAALLFDSRKESNEVNVRSYMSIMSKEKCRPQSRCLLMHTVGE